MAFLLRLLNAEPYPNWFKFQGKGTTTRSYKGFTGNYLLLLWSVMGMMIVFAFLSMFRASMMRPVMETPLDSTKDLVLANKQPILTYGAFWPNFLQTSENKWEREVGDKGVSAEDKQNLDDLLKTQTYSHGSHSIQMTAAQVSTSY